MEVQLVKNENLDFGLSVRYSFKTPYLELMFDGVNVEYKIPKEFANELIKLSINKCEQMEVKQHA